MTTITEQPEPTTDQLYAAWKAAPTPESERRLYDALRTYARAIARGVFGVNDPDVVTDIVTKAFLREASFRGQSQFGTWFYKVAMNYIRNYIRRRKRLREVQLKDIENLPAPDLFEEPEDPWQSGELRKSVAALTPDQKEFLTLKATMSLGEVATCLKISKKAAELRWGRLKRQLRQRHAACITGR